MKLSILATFALAAVVSAKSRTRKCKAAAIPDGAIAAVADTDSASVKETQTVSADGASTTNAPQAGSGGNATMTISGDGGDGEGDSKGQSFAQCIKEGTKNDAFLRPFANVKSSDDVSKVSYCRTDKACPNCPDSIYTNQDSTCDLSCNSFCFYSKQQGKIIASTKFTGASPPSQYFNCGAETCDNVKNCQ